MRANTQSLSHFCKTVNNNWRGVKELKDVQKKIIVDILKNCSQF